MTNPKRQFPANASSFFFGRDEFDYAVGVLAQRLAEGATVDFSCLPLLVAIGGFQYERGRREFAQWSDSMQAIVGGAVESLLRETWEAIPRSVAERFGAAINGGVANVELASLGRAYKQLQVSFRQTRGDSVIEMMSGLAKFNEAIHSTGQPPEPANGESENAHRHLCTSCGMPYGHGPWQCEPPDDQYCPMCAENVAGPIPIWIERWTPADMEHAAAEPAGRKSAIPWRRDDYSRCGSRFAHATGVSASSREPECRGNRDRKSYPEPHQARPRKGGGHGRTQGVALRRSRYSHA